MTRRTVPRSKDAYDALVSWKREGESLSEVVLRLAAREPSLVEFAGAWKGVSQEKRKAFAAFLERGDELSKEAAARERKRSTR